MEACPEPVEGFVKKKCLYAKYYRDFGSFTAAIQNCLTDSQTLQKNALTSLLTLNFQTFEKVPL